MLAARQMWAAVNRLGASFVPIALIPQALIPAVAGLLSARQEMLGKHSADLCFRVVWRDSRTAIGQRGRLNVSVRRVASPQVHLTQPAAGCHGQTLVTVS